MSAANLLHDLAAIKVMKDEGLTFCILMCLSLREASLLRAVQRLFLRVLKGRVVPLLALNERKWKIVSHYMSVSPDLLLQGQPRFEYSYDAICVEATLHLDFEGLRVLARRGYNFAAVHGHPRLLAFAREALRSGRLAHLSALRALEFDYSSVVAACASAGETSEQLQLDRTVAVDFLGSRLVYRRPALEFTGRDYIEQEIAALCTSREGLFRVPFVVASFLRAGACSGCLVRPDGCGYLLLLALVSESFNFVYLLVKEAIHLEAVFERYRAQLLQLVVRALEHRRFVALDLLCFCGYSLERSGEDVHRQFDSQLLGCLLDEDFAPVERMCCLGFSLRGLAERNEAEFSAYVQSRLEAMPQAAQPHGGSASFGEAVAGEKRPPPPSHAALRRLASLDRGALELHFRSSTFLEFAGALLSERSFVTLRQIVEVHRGALGVYFAEHCDSLEALLLAAFRFRDVALIVDISSLAFPMGAFFKRHQAEIDALLLGGWLANKCWTELGTLRGEIKQWSFPAFFQRNQERSDDFVMGIIANGYWFDLHNLAQLSFNFAAFFNRRFDQVSDAVVGFIETPQPHFVLLRELSALGFPWPRFMQVHCNRIPHAKEDDFLQFVISFEGFEVGSKVYGVVEQTCRLYHNMALRLFPAASPAPEPHHNGTSPPTTALEATSVANNGELQEERAGPSPAAPLPGVTTVVVTASGGSSGASGLEGSSAGVAAAAAGAVAARHHKRLRRAAAPAGGGCSGGDGSSSGSSAAALTIGCSHGGSSSSGGGGGGDGGGGGSGSAGISGGSSSNGSPSSSAATRLPPTVAANATSAMVAVAPGGSSSFRIEEIGLEEIEDEAGETEAAQASEVARTLRARAQDLSRRATEKTLDTKKIIALMVCKGAYCWNPLKADVDENQDGKEPGPWADAESAVIFLDSREEVAAGLAAAAARGQGHQASTVLYHQLWGNHLQAVVAGHGGAAAAAATAAAAAAVAAAAAAATVQGGGGGIGLGGGAAGGGAPAALAALATAGAAGGVPGGAVPNFMLPMTAHPPGGLGHFPGFSLPPPVMLPLGASGAAAQQVLYPAVCLLQRGEERNFAPRVDLFWSGILDAVLPLNGAAAV